MCVWEKESNKNSFVPIFTIHFIRFNATFFSGSCDSIRKNQKSSKKSPTKRCLAKHIVSECDSSRFPSLIFFFVIYKGFILFRSHGKKTGELSSDEWMQRIHSIHLNPLHPSRYYMIPIQALEGEIGSIFLHHTMLYWKIFYRIQVLIVCM